MRFLHTSDLHLGRRLNDIPLLDDQKIILKEIIAIAEAEHVDSLIIAGDVYNKSVPAADAMMALDGFLTELAEKNISIYMISGNHDSDERISYFSQLIKKAGINTTDGFDGKLQTIVTEDGHGPVAIHLMPFIRPVQIRGFYPEAEIVTYEDAAKAVLENSPVDASIRNILVAHQFITGAEISDSEEFAVGGLDNISASVFGDFDYVALGHLHKPQKTGRETVRYAGSPMKYSLSEANHKKSVTIVDFRAKGEAPEIRQIPLHAPHDVREVTGSMEQLLAMEYSEDYVKVTVTDRMVPPDARVSISTVFPNMIKMAVDNGTDGEDMEAVSHGNIEEKSKIDLFTDFYMMQNGGTEPSPEQKQILEDILKELEEENYEAN